MAGLLFGTGGTPRSSRALTTQAGIERIAELHLGCMEVEFVQGVRMSLPSAKAVGEVAARERVKLSAHAPYFVNLNAHEPEKLAASEQRLLHTARVAASLGARSIVFHAGFYLGDPPLKTYAVIKKALKVVLEQLKEEGNKVWMRPEVTGKPTQFGSLEEVLNLSAELEGVAPCIDFAHSHARTGGNNSYEEFRAILEQVEEKLGWKALVDMHIHLSGIAYSKKGELSHLNLKESDLRYEELLRALKDKKTAGLVICESPNLEGDAQLLQETYSSL